MTETLDKQKVKEIEKILKCADITHEMYYQTIYKIKRVIFTNANSQK